MEQPILQVEHLTKFFSVGPHAEVHAVDDVNFTLRRGRTFGLVGESGCGKSSCARTIIRIYEPSQGKIIFNGQDIAHLKPRQMQPVRRNMQMIFQDPYASLNARMTVRDIIAEPLKAHHVCKSKQEVDEKVFAMPRWPDGRTRRTVCPRVFRRPAPARRHCPRPGAEPRAGHL